MARGSRETNLGLRVGDTVIHCNDSFTIVDVRRQEEVDGMKLVIIATDSDQANKLHQDQITHSQLFEKMTELFNRLADKGLGGLEDIGKG